MRISLSQLGPRTPNVMGRGLGDSDKGGGRICLPSYEESIYTHLIIYIHIGFFGLISVYLIFG